MYVHPITMTWRFTNFHQVHLMILENNLFQLLSSFPDLNRNSDIASCNLIKMSPILFIKCLQSSSAIYWTSIKTKMSMTCVSKEYDIETKMVHEQWLLLKMLFYWVIIWKCYLVGVTHLSWKRIKIYWGSLLGEFFQVVTMNKFLADGRTGKTLCIQVYSCICNKERACWKSTVQLKKKWNFQQSDQEKVMWNFHPYWYFDLEFPRCATQRAISKGQVFFSLEFPRVKWQMNYSRKKTK